jgi:hypothetical protein
MLVAFFFCNFWQFLTVVLHVAHGHAVIVLNIGCSAKYVEDAGKRLWDCNPIDEAGPQLMVVSHVFGFLGGIGDMNNHGFHVGGLHLRG